MIRRAFLALALVCLSSLPARAEEPAEATTARTITFQETLRRARENPPAVLVALATLERFGAQEHYARGAYLPSLSFEGLGGVLYNDVPTLSFQEDPSSPNGVSAVKTRIDSKSLNAQGTASLNWTLFDRARGANVDSARAAAQAQGFATQATQRAALQAAAEIFLRGLASERLVEDARLTLERRSAQFASISALVKAGVRPPVDAQRAEIEAVAARHALEIRSIEQQANAAALAAALGDDPARPLRPAPFDADPLAIAPSGLNAATRGAIENRPELRQLEATLSTRQADDRSARGLRWPTAGLNGSGQVSYLDVRKGQGLDGPQYTASGALVLRWSALDPAAWRKAAITSKAVLEAQRQYEASLLQLRAEVAEASFGAERARAQLDQATEVLAAAEVTRQSQNERYRIGLASLLELLDAEEIEQRARLVRIETAREYDVARARLLSVCGMLVRLLE